MFFCVVSLVENRALAQHIPPPLLEFPTNFFFLNPPIIGIEPFKNWCGGGLKASEFYFGPILGLRHEAGTKLNNYPMYILLVIRIF